MKQLVADIIGKRARDITVSAVRRKYKGGKPDVVIRRLAGGTSEGLQEGFDFDLIKDKKEMRRK